MVSDNKKKLTRNEFDDLIKSEILACYSYYVLVRKKAKKEYVDILAGSYCEFCEELDYEVPIYYNAKNILEKDYNVDLYSLPFKNEMVKLEIKRYDLIKQLKSNNIDYDSFEVLDNPDPEIKKIVEELEKINNELLDYDDMNIYI